MPRNPRFANERLRAAEACRLLNEFVGDLVAGTRSLDLFEAPAFASKIDANTRVILRRMCLSHLVVTLSKWAALYDGYKAVIPSDVRAECQELRRAIVGRGIREFRNKVVGHIWDDTLKRPLSRAEIDMALARVLGGSLQSFLVWINNPKVNASASVVTICESVRDRISTEHSLTDSEIFG
jgi:hypothetical protein